MKDKVLFAFALITTVVLHSYVFHTVKIKHNVIAVEPQKKVSPIINLQHIAIKIPEPAVEEILPEPPKPVVEEVLVPMPPMIKKKAIKKVQKKKKVVKKKKKKTKPKKVAKVASKAQLSSPKRKAIKNSYLAKVRRTIEQRKKYPKAAKRLRQEGVVKVHFTIGKNGAIRDVRLAGKCSYSKLNKAAIKILKRIGAFAPIPKELNERYLSLVVPVRYKILN